MQTQNMTKQLWQQLDTYLVVIITLQIAVIIYGFIDIKQIHIKYLMFFLTTTVMLALLSQRIMRRIKQKEETQ